MKGIEIVDGRVLEGAPRAFFAAVLPDAQEEHRAQYGRALEALERGVYEREGSFFATKEGAPMGLVLVAGRGAGRRIEIVAVRQERRRQGLGRALLGRAVEAARQQGAQQVVAGGVSSANAGAVGLLRCSGFIGRSLGSLRMRRSLAGPLPASAVPAGYVLRPLRQGEEEAWVRLKNACFPESRAWGAEEFAGEFLRASFAAYGRIFVAVRGEELVGTASAWEVDYGEGAAGLVHWVGVEEGHRGKGLGEALSGRVLEVLQGLGYGVAWLNTSRDRGAAVRLYERLGFGVYRELYEYELAL